MPPVEAGPRMFAMAIDTFGGPECLYPVDLPMPDPGLGEVRVRVGHASVNPADAKARRGMLAKYITYHFPFVPGFDLAGTIDAIGPSVTRWTVGDRVFGTSRQGQGGNGSYAQYTIADAALLAPLPGGLTMAQAACLPTAGTTALGGLVDVGGLRAGQSVLINGAAGGVGSIAVQIARHLGATILGTCSAGNADYVTRLGADLTIDYARTDVVQAVRAHCPQGVDLVLDAVGLDTLLPRMAEIVRPGGTYVEIETLVSQASQADIERAALGGIRLVSNMIAVGNLLGQLQALGRLAAIGAVKPQVAATLPLRQAGEAHRHIETGHVRGKIALEVCADL